MGGTVLTVASGKGGVGKTTTAANLAVALWTDGNVVALVDGDLGMPNLATVLGVEPEATLHDVLAERAQLEDALVEAKDGDLLVLPGDKTLAGFAAADPDRLAEVVSTLADRCDYVVVDTGAGLSYEDLLPLGLADEVLLVTTPDPAAIADTEKTRELASILAAPVRGLVVTRVSDDTDAAAIAADVGVPLLGTVPEDSAVTESLHAGAPLASHAPDAPATAAYAALASTIVGAVDADDESPYGGSVHPESLSEQSTALEEATEAGTDTDQPPPNGAPSRDQAASPETDSPAEESTDESTTDEPAPPESAEPSGDESTETESDADASTTAPVETPTKKRGGLTGWLGRLFS